MLQLISWLGAAVQETRLPVVDELNASKTARFLHDQQWPFECFRDTVFPLVLLVAFTVEQANGENLDAGDSVVGHDLEQIVGGPVVRRGDRISTEQ